jgi:hypothetical protein
LDFVDSVSRRKDHVGWYDQYTKLADTQNIQDIILGLEGETIIAAALTYCTASPVAEDLPWASTIADDVGGVTCVCISGMRCILGEVPWNTTVLTFFDQMTLHLIFL